MAKVKRYNEGDLIEPGSGGISDRYNPPEEKPEGGRFDEETYARVRRFLERGGADEPAPATRPAAKKSSASTSSPVAPARKYGPEDIPGQSVKAPEGERIDSSELGRNLANIASAMTPGAARAMAGVGRGAGALARSAKEGFEVGRATARGAASRADIQAKRAARNAQAAEEMRRGQAGTKFESQASKPRTRAKKKFNEDEVSTEFNKGGSVRGWGQARGARKAKIY